MSRDHVLPVQVMSLLFGLGSWITITGFWAELPLLTQYLPEKWALSSQLTLAIQLANTGPFVYCLSKRHFDWCNDVTATHAQMVIGVVACFVLIFCWDWTVIVSGQPRSLYLMAAAFKLSLLDCTSSVTFLPFMARFHDRNLTPYLIGEGLSGLIPIVIAMIQGNDEGAAECGPAVGNITTTNTSQSKPTVLFGPSCFFFSLLATLCISWAAFIWLNYSEVAANECIPDQLKSLQLKVTVANSSVDNNDAKSVPLTGEDCICKPESGSAVGFNEYVTLQVIIVYACLSTFGIFPALQPYSTLPYGNWSLYYTVIGTGLAYPLGCSLAMITSVKSLYYIILYTSIGSLISVYLLVCALKSPLPPLIGQPIAGGSLVVICWIAYILMLSYVKTIVTLRMARARGENALYRVGIYTQIGSVFGAAFMFLAVNQFHWFQESSSACTE